MREMIDGHIHVTKELLPILEENCVYCIANSDNLEEYEWLKRACIPEKFCRKGMNSREKILQSAVNHNEIIISAGIHPWKADATDWQEMEPVLREAKIIGEIGLDNVWCRVDMEIQRKIFLQQLELARDLQKPVILHTKGMEKEILEIIREFPNRYLVHWYSCEAYLEEYIKMGCWFTVGPAMEDRAVEAVARNVPIERLLIESDGLEGISWGQNREIEAPDYIEAMEAHLCTVAEVRGCKAENLLEQMRQNLSEFIGISK